MTEIEGYTESGEKVAIGAEKPDGERHGAIKLLLYYFKNNKWIPYDGS